MRVLTIGLLPCAKTQPYLPLTTDRLLIASKQVTQLQIYILLFSADKLSILPKIECDGQILDDQEKWCHFL